LPCAACSRKRATGAKVAAVRGRRKARDGGGAPENSVAVADASKGNGVTNAIGAAIVCLSDSRRCWMGQTVKTDGKFNSSTEIVLTDLTRCADRI
jgi:hypothetical protein